MKKILITSISILLAIGIASLILTRERKTETPRLGAIELAISDKKSVIDTIQTDYFATKNKYKHIPWTVEGNVRYRVDESVYPDGSASYKKTIGSYVLTDFPTATGTDKRYVFTEYE